MNIHLLLCLSCLIFSINKIEAQYANTTNECFYAQGKFISGSIITRIPISGSQLENLLATCCTMCRALYHCVAWDFEVQQQTCAFYSEVKNISSNSNSYSGKNTASELWDCNERPDTWYFDSTLWVRKTNETSKESRSACCLDCFWSPGCISWMHNQNSMDCYHSNKNYNNTKTSK